MKKTGLLICLLVTPLFLGYNNTIKNSSLEIETINIPASNEKIIKLTEYARPVDPYYTGAKNIGGYSQSIAMSHIGNIESVWDKYKGAGVTIAVVDSGIDLNHPDFKDLSSNSRVSTLSASFTYDSKTKKVIKQVGIENLGHDYDEKKEKYNAHGTNVAGVSAATQNTVGVAGIAPEANLLILKSQLITNCANEAIKYAADNGADVINLSIGSYAEKWKPDAVKDVDYFPGSDTAMVEAINYAHNKGVIIVAAAGNENVSVHSYPAANKYVIGVGALEINSSNVKADYSNFNKPTETPLDDVNVDVVAPGTVITTQYNGKSTYTRIAGTSFAAPIVTGAAALWKQKNPKGTPEQFENDLFSSTFDIGEQGWDTTFGYGGINIGSLMTDFDIDASNITLDLTATHQIKATTKRPTDILIYESDDPKIASVSDTGLVTGVATGTTTIHVTYGKETKNMIVNVTNKYPPKPCGCGGNIATSSMIISLISISFISLLIIKKKRYEK